MLHLTYLQIAIVISATFTLTSLVFTLLEKRRNKIVTEYVQRLCECVYYTTILTRLSHDQEMELSSLSKKAHLPPEISFHRQEFDLVIDDQDFINAYYWTRDTGFHYKNLTAGIAEVDIKSINEEVNYFTISVSSILNIMSSDPNTSNNPYLQLLRENALSSLQTLGKEFVDKCVKVTKNNSVEIMWGEFKAFHDNIEIAKNLGIIDESQQNELKELITRTRATLDEYNKVVESAKNNYSKKVNS